MKPWMTTRELAKRWKMSPDTLANWRWSGEGPPYSKFGHSVLYKRTVIIVWEKTLRARARSI